MNTIKNDIKNGSFQNAYLLFGEESYLIDYYAKEIIKLNTDSETAEFNLLKISAEIPSEEEVDSFLNSYPFMSEKKVLYIRNSGLMKKASDAQKKYWSSVLENIPEYAIIIFAESEADKRSAIYKQFAGKYSVCEFEYQKPSELTNWAAKVLGKLSKKISAKDAAYIVELCGPSMQSIKNELEKLAAYTEGKDSICTADINSVVTKNIENRVFAMVDDMVENRGKEAFEKLNDLKALNEEPIKIISIIFNKYSLYKKLSILKGRPIREICTLTGLYEKYAKNYIRKLNNLNPYKIDSVMNTCMQMDFSVKNGKTEKWLAVEIVMSEAMKKD